MSNDGIKQVRRLPMQVVKKPKPAKQGHGKRSEKLTSQHRGVHEFSAGFLVFRETPAGRLWLLLDYGKHWDYAKGHLEEGETAWQAAVRELREETGIRRIDRVTRWQRNMHCAFFSSSKGPVTKTVTYFIGKTPTEEIKVSDEHMGFAWLPYDQAMERLTYDNARELLKGAQEAVEGELRC